MKKTNKQRIEKIVKKVKPTHCDNDPFPFSEVKNSERLPLILDIYTKIVNLCIENKIIPTTEKSALINPILKTNLDSQCLKSYRPVSNLPFLSKIIENVILDQLQTHLNDNNILPDNQSAYRQMYSTETALCSIVNDLIINTEKGECSLLILLDLSAAFDTVVHNTLYKDLKKIGIDGDALELLSNYLQGRTYNVKIRNSISQIKPLTRGVPQGSVLGPILFCIYTIELSYILRKHNVKFKLFADDTQFYLTVNDINETVRSITTIITEIKNWMNYKKLKLNEDKTECLLIGKKSKLLALNIRNINLMGNKVKITEQIKSLGVIFDETLSFNAQINQATRTAGYHLRNIAFIKKYLDESLITKLVHNFVLSRLDYCNSLYYGLPNYQLKKLQNIQNRAARLIKGTSTRDRITPVLIDLHWLPIKARITFKICTLAFQALKFNKPQYLRNTLKEFKPSTNITLRHALEPLRLEQQRSLSKLGDRAFERCVPTLMNNIPKDIKQCDDVKIFKRKLKTHIFNECYNMIEQKINDNYKL